MRNLKRALSLALASVMLLGMMVVGAGAASYPDVDAEDNVEAIEVLNAVKVMIGDHGNFNPDKAVNRHEMAVIMAKLVLGNEAADNYVGTHPYTDVAPWADKYVAACYENGLTSGTSATTYGGQQSLTAVQAAAMMLRALGYKDLSKGATDWRAPVTAAANRIRLFADVASNPSEKLTRNQVAQLALNTLKSPMVDTKDGLSIVGGNGDISFTINGDREYVVRSSTNRTVSGAILDNENLGNGSDGLGGWALELGEHLYNGKLRLTETVDDFGRPARHWEYDGKAIGDYAKEELLRATYVEEVKGGKIYDDVGSEACGYEVFEYWIDGRELTGTALTNEQAKLVRRGSTVVGPANASGVVVDGTQDNQTARGTLTEVYVNPQDHKLTIVEIHTYLARAVADYDAKNESLSITVYTGRNSDGSIQPVSKRLELEDFPSIAGYKKDDFVMVTMAGTGTITTKDIMSISDPQVVSDAYVSAYSADIGTGVNANSPRLTKVTADGKVYNISAKAYWDPAYLFNYAQEQLDGFRYDLLLDEYGNLLGIKNVSAAENVFFVVGYEPGATLWGTTNDKAFVIFPDGTSGQVTTKLKNSNTTVYGAGVNGSDIINNWYSYTLNSDGVYVISGLTNRQFVETRATDGTAKVNSVYTTMADTTANGAYNIRHDTGTPNPFVYGNDASVYIAVETKTVGSSTRIDKVGGVTTGIKNVNIAPNGTVQHAGGTGGDSTNTRNVFGLYNSDGYVTYAVVIGKDGGAASNMVYLTSDIKGSYYDSENKQYVWQYEAITKDSTEPVIVDSLTKVDTRSNTSWLAAHTLYKATYDSKGFITEMERKFDNRAVPASGADDRTGPYNTHYYKEDGYGVYTLDRDTKVRLSGNTLFLDPNDNDKYVLITGDTRFFVDGKDDTDGKYNLYPNAASALAALGNNNTVTYLKADGTPGNARITIIADTATGFANTVIIKDEQYEGSAGSGSGNGSMGISSVTCTQSGVNVTVTATVNSSYASNENFIIQYELHRIDWGTGNRVMIASGRADHTATYGSSSWSITWPLNAATYYLVINGTTYGPFIVS